MKLDKPNNFYYVRDLPDLSNLKTKAYYTVFGDQVRSITINGDGTYNLIADENNWTNHNLPLMLTHFTYDCDEDDKLAKICWDENTFSINWNDDQGCFTPITEDDLTCEENDIVYDSSQYEEPIKLEQIIEKVEDIKTDFSLSYELHQAIDAISWHLRRL